MLVIATSNLAPGLISIKMCASSSPAFHQSCAVPAGTCRRSPCFAMDSRPSMRKPTRPRTTVNHSSMMGCMCSPATAPPGRTYTSATSNSPPESSVPTRTTARSPVTGFSRTSPALDIVRSFSLSGWRDARLPPRTSPDREHPSEAGSRAYHADGLFLVPFPWYFGGLNSSVQVGHEASIR